MKIRCVIIDDEPSAIKILKDYVSSISEMELLESFTEPVKAVSFLNDNEVDLLFIDIQMPDLNGFELVSKLKNKPLLIFTTAYEQYALEGFKIDAIDYLLKPIDFDDFNKAANKAINWFHVKKQSAEKPLVKSNKNFLFIKSEYRIIRIELNDITYIEGINEYVKIHLVTGKPIMTLMRMKNFEQQLPEDTFMRVHKSYIVNLTKVKTIERNTIIYDGGVVIPVGLQYKGQFQKYIENNFII
jgi:DNA-binding LytR/AlgR family response regulator